MTAAEVTEEPAVGRTARQLAGAAVLIGVITILARLAGFGRIVVFSQTVRTSCLGQAYYTANQVPNIVFEIVAGGALAGMVVPVLAGPVERGDHEHVRRTTSALLTWMAIGLVPLSLLGMLLARPIMNTMVRGGLDQCSRADVVTVGTHMLVVFAPQIALYGFAVVLYGVLQAHRRFIGPALAPLMSSLVVIGAYLAYVPLGHGRQDDLARLPRSAELMLSAGTTVGVLVLLATAGVAAVRLRLRLRPTLRFPPDTAGRVRRLAIAGLATVAAQQLSAVAVVMLSGRGTRGALADYQYAWALFLLPWAVLAVPIATSAFPMLSARAGVGETGEFDRITASTTRAIVLVSCAGAAGLAAIAVPAATFLDHDAVPAVLARAVLAFAPGLIGYGFVAHLGRVLFACHRGRDSAGATVLGWLVVIGADLALVFTLPRDWVVAGLALGNTAGMTVAGVLLLAALVRVRGRGAVAGVGRAMAAGVAGALAGGAAGYGVAAAIGATGQLTSIGAAAVAGLTACAVFALVTYALDGRDLKAVIGRRMR
ncbi:putative peptidoglycan lipid II flippase [Actinoallomurus bryophytorum]|uniref:Putative peptidoglycan lipid II flippase n=1 Tax=Actinoallomurus bryophytorum TaxID=1490222 RepID=A0A543CWL9_9ACTN|nr:lipid II flippase MurJ [Actinoallomurus bryophytorum]TQM01258.1 putative peptidoglycan lipid II flippase [Actinoallomurus bryophytorum]